jgi:two-component system KDP operon response regulator KdpE
VLEVLVSNAGTVVLHADLLREVWGNGYEMETNYLRLYVAQLRSKLEADPSKPVHLLTEQGRGYRFSAE